MPQTAVAVAPPTSQTSMAASAVPGSAVPGSAVTAGAPAPVASGSSSQSHYHHHQYNHSNADVPMPSSSSVASRLSALSRIQQRPHSRHKRLGKYILGQTIGEGEFGKVKLAWAETETGERRQYAIKLLRQDRLRGVDQAQRDKVNHEINALQACRHPHVIRLEDLLQNVHYIGIVLDYASGGDMFSHIYKNGRLEERTAQRLFAQLVSGVHYLHQKGIVHRDLKLENLLLDGNNKILISDFGFANSFRSSRGYTLMKTSCGSPCYAAPEVVNSDKNYDGRKVDIWSVGVILFTFLAGYLPFDDDPKNPDSEDIQRLYRYIANTPLKFPDWIGLEARDLLRRILVVDPERRAKMQDIMAHRWLAEHRAFLSITPAEHEGSTPWQQSQQQQQQQQSQQQSQHRRRTSVAYNSRALTAATTPAGASTVNLARSASASAAAAAMPRYSAGATASGGAAAAGASAAASAASAQRAPVRSVSKPQVAMMPDTKAAKRQSAHPSLAYTQPKPEEVPELGIAPPPPPQRLAPATKPRPISFQPKSTTSTDSSFELVNGSSLYMPRTSQPRVALNRETSKSGEMSRPLSYVNEDETEPRRGGHHYRSMSQVPYQDQSQGQSQGQSHGYGHGHSQSFSQAPGHARRQSAAPAIPSSIPRSTSYSARHEPRGAENRSAEPSDTSNVPSTPLLKSTTNVANALGMETPQRLELIPPVRRTSVRTSQEAPQSTRAERRVSAIINSPPVQADSPVDDSPIDTQFDAQYGAQSEVPAQHTTQHTAQPVAQPQSQIPIHVADQRPPQPGQYNSSDTSSNAVPPSRSRFRLSSALWSRKSYVTPEEDRTASAAAADRRASTYIAPQSPSQTNVAAGTAAAASQRRQSGIPVKNKEPSNLKKKTLNFFKRRSMIG